MPNNNVIPKSEYKAIDPLISQTIIKFGFLSNLGLIIIFWKIPPVCIDFLIVFLKCNFPLLACLMCLLNLIANLFPNLYVCSNKILLSLGSVYKKSNSDNCVFGSSSEGMYESLALFRSSLNISNIFISSKLLNLFLFIKLVIEDISSKS